MLSRNLQNFEFALAAGYIPVRTAASEVALTFADPAGIEPSVTFFLNLGRIYDLFSMAPEAWLRASQSLQGALLSELVVVQVNLVPTTPVPSPTPPATLGSAYQKIRTITTDYAIQPDDYSILVDASAGPVSVTLPLATSETDRVLVIKKIDVSSNNVTIVPVVPATIEGETTYVLATQYESASLHCNGQNFFLL